MCHKGYRLSFDGRTCVGKHVSIVFYDFASVNLLPFKRNSYSKFHIYF